VDHGNIPNDVRCALECLDQYNLDNQYQVCYKSGNSDRCRSYKGCMESVSGVGSKLLDLPFAIDDIDECTLNKHDCDPHANCTNTIGSYNCSCNEGFAGNGYNCTDIDECTEHHHHTQLHDCDPQANCTNTIGSYNCSCNEGFTGDGYNCTDIDECILDEHDCDSEANCTNTIGSYNCSCKDGFTEDGYNCTEICATPGICHANATCISTGSGDGYRCRCVQGFYGSAIGGDASSCTVRCGERKYADNGVCKESQAVYSIEIELKEEYTEDLGNTMTPAFEDLAYTVEQSFTRALNNPSIGQIKVVQFRNGSLFATMEIHIRGTSGSANITADSLAHSIRNAVMNDEMFVVPGNIRVDTETDAESGLSLNCEERNLTASVDASKLGGNILNLTIPQCTVQNDTVQGNTVHVNFKDCIQHEIVHQGNNTISQKLTLVVLVGVNDAKMVIERTTTYRYILQCDFNRRLGVSNSKATKVGAYKAPTVVKKAKTNFTAAMIFYTSLQLDTPAVTPLQVDAYQPIFIFIESVHPNPSLKFITEECYATPTADANSVVKYLFFHERCAIDMTFRPLSLQNNHEYAFSIDAFAFITVKKEVYFHCTLLICASSSNSTECSQECVKGGRRRRDVDSSEDNGEEGIERYTVNSPVIQYKRKSTCLEKQCPDHATCVGLHPAVCRCDDGYVHVPMSNTCSDKRLLMVRNFNLHKRFHQSYANMESRDFLQLAQQVEQDIMQSDTFDNTVIKGVKCVKAYQHKGDVAVDLSVKFSDDLSRTAAFDKFLEAYYKYEDGLLVDVKQHILPILDVDVGEDVGYSTEVVVMVAVIVPLITLLFIALSLYVCKSCKNASTDSKKEKVVDNGNAITETALST